MERRAVRVPGFLMLLVTVVEVALTVALFVYYDLKANKGALTLVGVTGLLVLIVLSAGFLVLNPNEARVIQFFGRYVGSIRDAGFHWTVPFSTKRLISLRVRNFESAV